MKPNMELKTRMIKAGIPSGIWQSFLMCQDESDVDRLVAKAQRRIQEYEKDGIKPEFSKPDHDIIEWSESVKALF